MGERTVRVGEVDLVIAEGGEGGRPLLLVHGFTGAKEDFTDYLEPLVELGFHVVIPDLRGHGSSGRPADEEAYTLASFADEVVELADRLGWERFSLLGHSMGGMVAQLVAGAVPHRLERLVLMGTSHTVPPGLDPEIMRLGQEVARTQGLETVLALQKMGRSPLENEANLRVLAQRPDYEEFGDRKFLACSVHMWCGVVEEFLLAEDRLEVLDGVDVPALVLVGELDTPFHGGSRRLAETMPRSRLVTLPDAGHSPQMETPELWWEQVAGFLNGD